MDVAEILVELTRTTGLPPVTATAIERYLVSPISFWCDWHAPEEFKDPISPYQQHVFDSAIDTVLRSPSRLIMENSAGSKPWAAPAKPR